MVRFFKESKSLTMSFKAECERKWVRCVEELLERDITEEQLIKSADILCTSQYGDVIEERNIGGLCGYPLCNSPLGPVPKQKYHISVDRRQIYDMTERKKFCSNVCYKSSEFFCSQLSEAPLWLRTEPRLTRIKLMSQQDSAAIPSQSVSTHTTIPKSPVTTPNVETEIVGTKRSRIISPLKPTPLSASADPVSGQIAIKENIPISTSAEIGREALGRRAKSDHTLGPQTPKVSQVSKLLSAISTWLSVPAPVKVDSHMSCDTRAPEDQGHGSGLPLNFGEQHEEQQPHDQSPDKYKERSHVDIGGTQDVEIERTVGTLEKASLSEDNTLDGETVMLPPVDSVNVSRIQRNVFNGQLHRHLSTVCSALDLSLSQVLSNVNSTTENFRFTRHCITFRVPEWKIIAALLIKISCKVDVESSTEIEKWLAEIKATPEDFKLMVASFDQHT